MNRTPKNIALVGVAVVALGVAAYLVFARDGQTRLPSTYMTHGICLSCKKEGVVHHDKTATNPFKCPDCGRLAFYPWYFCSDCSQRSVPDLVRADPAGPWRVRGFPVCRACRSNHIGAWLPNLPDQKPAADAPLPEWTP